MRVGKSHRRMRLAAVPHLTQGSAGILIVACLWDALVDEGR